MNLESEILDKAKEVRPRKKKVELKLAGNLTSQIYKFQDMQTLIDGYEGGFAALAIEIRGYAQSPIDVTLPSGKMQGDESLKDAVLRSIREQFGLVLSSEDLYVPPLHRHRKRRGQPLHHIFVVEYPPDNLPDLLPTKR